MVEKDVMSDEPCGRDDLEAGLDEDESVGRARWTDLFIFCRGPNTSILISAILFTIISGTILPGQAIFLGKMFNLFTSLGSGQLSGLDLIEHMTSFAFRFCIFGAVSGVSNSFFFGTWITFSELQAKLARENIFTSMLKKEIAWFDARRAGVETFVSRLQT